jgi:hypothetical protein
VSSSITIFRLSLQEHLEDVLQRPVIAGLLEGPLDQQLACVFPASIREVQRPVLDEQLFLTARVFEPFVAQADLPVPAHDPLPLEDLAERLQKSIRDAQTTLGPWFARVMQIDFDLQRNAFEATLMGWQQNKGLLP